VDLSFARLERDMTVAVMPTELAVLMVGVAARQAASPTAQVQAHLSAAAPVDALLAPTHGAFHRPAAQSLSRWKQE